MRWYKPLYVGKRIRKEKKKMIQLINEGKWHPTLHVIISCQNGNNILEIYPMSAWLHYSRKYPDVLVVGIAGGYQESLELVRKIVDDLYHKAGAAYVWARQSAESPPPHGRRTEVE